MGLRLRTFSGWVLLFGSPLPVFTLVSMRRLGDGASHLNEPCAPDKPSENALVRRRRFCLDFRSSSLDRLGEVFRFFLPYPLRAVFAQRETDRTPCDKKHPLSYKPQSPKWKGHAAPPSNLLLAGPRKQQRLMPPILESWNSRPFFSLYLNGPPCSQPPCISPESPTGDSRVT